MDMIINTLHNCKPLRPIFHMFLQTVTKTLIKNFFVIFLTLEILHLYLQEPLHNKGNGLPNRTNVGPDLTKNLSLDLWTISVSSFGRS